MTQFHYPLPGSGEDSQFEVLSPAAIDAVVGQTEVGSAIDNLKTKKESLLGNAALNWARLELDDPDHGAIARWKRYESDLGVSVPESTDAWLKRRPRIARTISRLYLARRAMMDSNELTPDGVNVGDSMHLVMMPWGAFLQNRRDLRTWLHKVRSGTNPSPSDSIDIDIVNIVGRSRLQEFGDMFTSGNRLALYRDHDNPEVRLGAREYLRQKIRRSGPWGLVLMQTSDRAGLQSLMALASEARTADSLTARGTFRMKVAGQVADAMGIFEWLALTLQQKPELPSSTDRSLLLANRYQVLYSSRNGVPIAAHLGGVPTIIDGNCGGIADDTQPRLAVS